MGTFLLLQTILPCRKNAYLFGFVLFLECLNIDESSFLIPNKQLIMENIWIFKIFFFLSITFSHQPQINLNICFMIDYKIVFGKQTFSYELPKVKK